jgi:hypothetical protein
LAGWVWDSTSGSTTSLKWAKTRGPQYCEKVKVK